MRRERQRDAPASASASAPAAPRALSAREIAATEYAAREATTNAAIERVQMLGIAVHDAHAEFLDPNGLFDIERLRKIFPVLLGPNDFAPRMRHVAHTALNQPTQEMMITAAVVGALGLSTTVPDLSRYGISFPNITALEVKPSSVLLARRTLHALATNKFDGVKSLRGAMNVVNWLVVRRPLGTGPLEDGDLLLPESSLTALMRREAADVIELPEGPQKDAERRDWFDAYGSRGKDRIRMGAGLVLAGLVLFAPPQTNLEGESRS